MSCTNGPKGGMHVKDFIMYNCYCTYTKMKPEAKSIERGMDVHVLSIRF